MYIIFTIQTGDCDLIKRPRYPVT